MKYKILELFILLSVAHYLDGQVARPSLSSDPRTPADKTRVAITCKWTTNPLFVYFSISGFDASISYDVSKDSISYGDLMAKWRKSDDYTVVGNTVLKTLKVSFQVEAAEQNTYICSTVRGASFLSKELKLNVTYAPKVMSVEVISANPNKKSLYSSEMVTFKCTIALGNPPALDSDINFDVMRDGKRKFEKKWKTTDISTVGKKKTKILEFQRSVTASDNGASVTCYAKNSVDYSPVKKKYLNVLYSTKNLQFPVSENQNVSVGGEIRCRAQGNPGPKVVIAVYQYPDKDEYWASKGATGISTAILKIPMNATLTRYYLTCNASNSLGSKFTAMVPFDVIATSANPKPQNQATTAYMPFFIGGAILGVLLLLIIGAVVYFLVQRRKKSQTKTPSTDYQPVSTKPTDQQGAAELEKDTGPYDIDDTYKSGSQHEPYGGSKDGRQSGLYYSDSIGGVNGQQHFPESGDQSVEHNLNYASLDFDETPRSRVPIVFKDSDKVDYAEIVSSHPFNYDDEHFYENVRHHNV